jgi:FAD/FMN-containing dehydrogenase
MLPGCPFEAPTREVGFVVIAEADGTPDQAAAGRAALAEALEPGALAVHQPSGSGEVADLWRWREGLGYAVEGALGGKVSEDIVVPVDRLLEAVEATEEIGMRHGLRSCSWGHAGDGNLHSTFLISPGSAADLDSAEAAAEELFALAGRLGGAVSGEHGLGTAKSGQLHHQWDSRATALHTEIKRLFDPKNLLNPQKKLA